MFTVKPSTSWLCDRASLMASVMTSERDTRTVKQVRNPVHGATGNLMAARPRQHDGAGDNLSALFPNPEGNLMASFKVKPQTSRLHDCASLMASMMAFERDTRTVKQVSLSVHGANGNLFGFGTPTDPRGRCHPQRCSCPALPSAPWSAFSRHLGLGRCVQQRRDARPASSRASASPNDAIPLRLAGDASLRP